MKKILLVLTIIILIGCTPLPEDSLKGEECCLEESNEIETKTETPTMEQVEYSLKQLQDDLDNITINHFTWEEDEFYPTYYDGNEPRFTSVKLTEERISSAAEFHKHFSAPDWKGDERYFNLSYMRLLHKPLGQDKFNSDKSFFKYNTERIKVEHIEQEKVFEVENGKVLEYQQLNWMYTNGNHFDGVWADTLLIYKIYCSSKYVVLLRPEWKKYEVTLNFQMPEAHKAWEDIIEQRLRPDLLNKSNEILRRCPVTKEFFEDFPSQDYYFTEELTYEDAANLRYYWKIDTEAVPEIKYDEEEGAYVLDRVNLTFINKEEFALYGALNVDIDVSTDGGTKESFVDAKSVALQIDLNQNSSRPYQTTKNIFFKHNFTIDVYLYRWWEGPIKPIRPTTYTFDVNGTLLKKAEIKI